MNKVNHQFISIDWGTTNFRLRLVDRASVSIISDYKSDRGILKTYDQYNAQNEISQTDFFADIILKAVTDISHDLACLPIVLSGMASSSIGLQELPYADFPFKEDGTSLTREVPSLKNGLTIILVSGVRSDTGMIRGEEIQAIGLAEYMIGEEESGILILPGTHSKHMTYDKGIFSDLKNYMTGELFDVLSQKSILAKSVRKSDMTDAYNKSFITGLDIGAKGDLNTHLLSVRANDVIHHTDAHENYFYLSGLLIGDELKKLNHQSETIYLSASQPLFNLYKLALEHLYPAKNLTYFDQDISDEALIRGQLKILKQYETYLK